MRNLIVRLLHGYKRWISPFLGQHCRFYPTCSEYAATAVQEKGVVKGGWLAAKRILRCNPWNPGGVDFVPGHKENH